MRAVIGAMCTFHRPDDLRISLDALSGQSRQLDRLVIVDNGSDPETSAIVAAHPLSSHIPIEIVDPQMNLGPAGGYASAFDRVAEFADDEDLLLVLDDDDPPPDPTMVADLVDVADRMFTDPAVAGVGLRGGQLDLRTGTIAARPRTTTAAVESADHLHGGWLPTYRVGALRSTDVFDRDFFWGFDDLEIGRRLHRAGYTLMVAAEPFRRVSDLRRRRRDFRLAASSWRHYYRHRNLLRVLRRDRAFGAIALTIAIRLVGKPLANMVVSPRLALWHLRTNLDAIRDGLGGDDRAVHPRHRPPAGTTRDENR